GYSAGLDTSGQDLDGRYTIKWRDLISQLVFHVGTLMPDCQNKNERLVRKKSHMGNDFVHIVFNESGRDYEFDTIPSEFNYVQIIVAPVDGSIPSHEADSSWLYGDTGDAETKCVQLYKVKTQANASIPFVGPAMEPKLLTLTALPAFVRTIAIHAAILSQVYSECKKNKGISEFISPWRARLQAIKRIRVAAEKEAAKQSPHVRCPPASRGQSNSLPDFSRATAEQALDHLTNELSLFYNSRY
ncbi:Tuberous sclerosis 2-like protein, partial [Dipsacomyces acuminosporus]